MKDIEPIIAPALPFDPDAKLFCTCEWEDDKTECDCEKYSLNDWYRSIESISGVNPELLGA